MQKIPSKITRVSVLFLKAKSFPVYSSATFHLLILQLPLSPVWIEESTARDWCLWTPNLRRQNCFILSLCCLSFQFLRLNLVGFHSVLSTSSGFCSSAWKPFFPLISLNTNETKLCFHFRPALFHPCLAEGYKGQLHKAHFTNEHCSDILSAELQGVVTNTKGNISLLTFQKIRFWNPFSNSRPWSVGLIGKVPLNSRIASL